MLPAVIHKSFTLERTYPTSRARVFAALADPKKKRRWFAESTGFVIAEYSLDFQVGGFERTRFRYGADGPPMTNDCVYLDIQPEERVVFAYAMTIGGAPLSSSLGTMELRDVPGGTLLLYTEQTAYTNGQDGHEGRREGTIGLLERLARELSEHA
jgi:uncharacterized protein YndB with AHSA1/START domain